MARSVEINYKSDNGYEVLYPRGSFEILDIKNITVSTNTYDTYVILPKNIAEYSMIVLFCMGSFKAVGRQQALIKLKNGDYGEILRLYRPAIQLEKNLYYICSNIIIQDKVAFMTYNNSQCEVDLTNGSVNGRYYTSILELGDDNKIYFIGPISDGEVSNTYTIDSMKILLFP